MNSLSVAVKARVISTAPFVKKIIMSNRWVFQQLRLIIIVELLKNALKIHENASNLKNFSPAAPSGTAGAILF